MCFQSVKIIHVGFNTDVCGKLPDVLGAQQILNLAALK